MWEEHSGRIVGAILSAILAGFYWVVRTVFTNNKKIIVIETKMENKEEKDKERHEETQKSIATLVDSNNKAMANQQEIMKSLIERHSREN